MANEKSPLDGVQDMSNTRFDMVRWCVSSRKRRIITLLFVVFCIMLLVSPNFRSWNVNKASQFLGWFDQLFATTDTGTSTTSSTTAHDAASYLIVKDNNTNVRKAATTKSERVTTLSRGSKVYPTGEREGNWIPIKLEDGTPGFIREDLVRSP